jgi:hypothetical protein
MMWCESARPFRGPVLDVLQQGFHVVIQAVSSHVIDLIHLQGLRLVERGFLMSLLLFDGMTWP